jgi:hypothetical protein
MNRFFLKYLLVLISCILLGSVNAVADMTNPVVLNDTLVMELSDIIAKGLPTMCFSTVDGEEPTCDYVSAPPGCMGKTITNATKVPGRLVIYMRIADVDSIIYDSGDYLKDVSGMTIKIRGNTSAYDSKKPYKIKLQKKRDLLFRGNESLYKDKEWVLIKDDYLLATAGFKVNELLGLPWTPGHHYVNVILNGNFKGVYLLCESVKRNPDCRLNVDKYTGYIFECDPYWWNEEVYVNSITSPSYNFTFKYPDSDDIQSEQLDYIQAVVTAYEQSLSKSNYPDKIDVASFAAWCLGHDIAGTEDAGGTNRFYTKYDNTDTSKIFMPLMWDYDLGGRTTNAWSRCHTVHFAKLFNNANRTFVDEFVWLWRKVGSTFYSDIMGFLNEFRSSPEGVAMDASTHMEEMLYGWDFSIDNVVSDHDEWYKKRARWLNNKINALNPKGDVNIDAHVDIVDVTALVDMLLTGVVAYRHAADVNDDGQVNIADVTAVVDIILNANN